MAKWQAFVAGAVLGAVLALGVAYLYTKEYRTFMAHAPYYRAASEAQLDIALLRKLKAADFAGASELADARLKMNEQTLAEYRGVFPQAEQDVTVLAGATAIEQYRSESHQ
jgi:hypothetical protein